MEDVVNFVIGSVGQIDSRDAVKFTGVKGTRTLRFWITRDALERLNGGTKHGESLLTIFDPFKERIWAIAKQKVADGLGSDDDTFLIDEEDVG